MRLLFVALASLIGYVNPFVGTDGHGHTFPGAACPFGMVQLSPDNRPSAGDWDGCSGYHWSSDTIYGFSHTHLSGTGCDDLCDVLLMPGGEPSTFSHDREKASPGYYEVFLDGPQTLVRLTAGRRSGYHEYIFPEGVAPSVLLNLKHRDYLVQGSIAVEGNAVSGHRKSSSWSRDQDVYFWVEFSQAVSAADLRTSVNDVADFAGTTGTGGGVSIWQTPAEGVLLHFSGDNVLSVRVGISSVSVENARENLAADGHASFEDALEATQKEWNGYLAKLKCPARPLDGARETAAQREERRRVFYTALYHCAIHPSLYSDANGEYRGMDRQVHRAERWDRYTVFSLWDTFRGHHPLLCEIEPDRTVDFLKSFISIYKEAGKLPVWELWGWETNCMIGYNSAPVIADVLSRGMVDGVRLTRSDVELLFEALEASANNGEFGLDSYRANGLVLADDEHESVSKTLEYAFDDWCTAQVAGWLGNEEAYQRYMTSAQYWRNVFDPSTGFMRARLNGRWLAPFNPREVNNHFTEANSWQYSFFVPQDIDGLIEVHGGAGGLEMKLDSLFSAPEQTSGRQQVDITGLIGQYAHGNEPSHHVAWLYDYVCGTPGQKTAAGSGKSVAMASRIMRELYGSAPDGLCGNDDCGQMSAWYVLSALGRYPVTPGARLGEMTCIPKTIVVNPAFEMENDIFLDSVEVKVVNIEPGATAWLSIDGGEFSPYSGPFVVKKNTSMQIYSQLPDGRRSFISRCSVHKIKSDRTVTLKSRYLNQYSAGGDEGLIDSLRGGLNWRTGGWQGYQDCDFEAVVDLKSVRELSHVGAGFLQDARSWIWMPRYVVFSVSDDGVSFREVARVDNTMDPQDYEVKVWDCDAPVNVSARYVKVFAGNFGTIPEWHPGAGGEGIIFIDELWAE